jgi:hypothetical protein
MLGVAVDAITSGALVQHGPWPRDLIFVVVIGLLILSATLIAISLETVLRHRAAWQSLRPNVRPNQAWLCLGEDVLGGAV